MLSSSRGGVQGISAQAPGEKWQLPGKQANQPSENTRTHRFSDTAETSSPAQRAIDGVFGLPVALRVPERAYFV